MKRLITLLLLGFAPWCMGDPVVFNYSGTCTNYCEVVGLELADTVTGWVEFEWDGGDTLTTEDMLSFNFTLGDLVFTESTTKVFSILVELLGDQVALFDFRLSNSTDHTSQLNSTRLVSEARSGVSPWGHCNESCSFHSMTNEATISDGAMALAFANPPSHSVPEPGTFALMGMALLGLAFRRKLA